MHTSSILLLSGAALAMAKPFVPQPPPTATRPAVVGRRAAAVLPRATPTDSSSSTDELIESCMEDYMSLANTKPTPAPALDEWLQGDGGEHEDVVIPDLGAVGPDMMTKLCDHPEATPPASLRSAYRSWTSADARWATAKKSDIFSMQRNCPDDVAIMVGFLAMHDDASCTSVVQDMIDNAASSSSMTAEVPGTSTSVSRPAQTSAVVDDDDEDDDGIDDDEDDDAVPIDDDDEDLLDDDEDLDDEDDDFVDDDDEDDDDDDADVVTGAAPRETGFVAAVAAMAGFAAVMAAL